MDVQILSIINNFLKFLKMHNLKLSSFRLLFVAVTLLSSVSFYGLQAQISSTTITVKSLSVAPTGATAAPSAICTGSSTSLSVQGGSLGTGAIWNWYADGCGTGGSIGTGPGITVSPTNVTTAPITRTYYVRAEGDCNTTTCAQVTVTINPTPNFTAPLNATYCVGDNVPAQALTGTPTGITYDISGGADVGLANATGVTQIPAFTATNTTNASMTRTITLTPQANGCTGAPQTFTITVTPNVVIAPIPDQILCNGTPTNAVTISSNVGTGVTYNWTNNTPSIGLSATGTGDIASFTAVNTTCADIVATITVTPTVTDGSTNCTQSPVTFTFTVRPTPNGTIASNDPICEGEQALLTFTSTCGTGPFGLAIRQDGVTPAQGYAGIISGSVFNVTPNPTVPGLHTYDLMVITDANGCVRQ